VNVSLGTLGSALNEFARIKGPAISPDGLLGGLGYIMPIKGIKEALTTSVHSLGEVADSIADELTNPHWKAEDDKETKELIKEKEKVEEETQKALEPEGEVSEESEEEPEEEPDEEEPEEKPAEESKPVVAPAPEQFEEGIKPEDVVTSKNVYASAEKSLSEAVKKALVRFSSVGKKI
jgi:outer membrane biosynthesis protein TonB